MVALPVSAITGLLAFGLYKCCSVRFSILGENPSEEVDEDYYYYYE